MLDGKRLEEYSAKSAQRQSGAQPKPKVQKHKAAAQEDSEHTSAQSLTHTSKPTDEPEVATPSIDVAMVKRKKKAATVEAVEAVEAAKITQEATVLEDSQEKKKKKKKSKESSIEDPHADQSSIDPAPISDQTGDVVEASTTETPADEAEHDDDTRSTQTHKSREGKAKVPKGRQSKKPRLVVTSFDPSESSQSGALTVINVKRTAQHSTTLLPWETDPGNATPGGWD